MPQIELLRLINEIQNLLLSDPARIEREHYLILGRINEFIYPIISGPFAENQKEQTVYGSYLAVDTQTRQVVGTCAFKSAPSVRGEVEIAYYTFPPFEGRGYGTGMARHLVAIALEDPAVNRVTARTLREQSASTSILKKIGMDFAGEVLDPEDGLVWEWEVRR